MASSTSYPDHGPLVSGSRRLLCTLALLLAGWPAAALADPEEPAPSVSAEASEEPATEEPAAEEAEPEEEGDDDAEPDDGPATKTTLTETQPDEDTVKPKLSGSLKTYVRLWEDVSPTNRAARRYRLPILQTIHVAARDVGVEGLSMEVLGYAELDTIEPLMGDRGRGDLALATITYHGLPDRMLFVRFGRQIVHGGAANNAIIDGLQVRVQLPYNLFVEAWGGFTAEPEFKQTADQWQLGTRAAWNFFGAGHLALSFAHEEEGGDVAREVLGVEAAWRNLDWISVVGYLLFDTVELDLDELHLYAELQFERQYRGHLEYRRFNPAARVPKTSIFSVFSDSLYDEFTASASYQPTTGSLALHAAGSLFYYPDGDFGMRVVVRPRWLFDRAAGELVGMEFGRVQSHRNSYWSVRAYGTWAPWRRVYLTADTEHAIYDNPIHGRSFSSVSRVTAALELAPGLTLMGEAGVTLSPTYEQQWLGMLRLTYALSGEVYSRAVTP